MKIHHERIDLHKLDDSPASTSVHIWEAAISWDLNCNVALGPVGLAVAALPLRIEGPGVQGLTDVCEICPTDSTVTCIHAHACAKVDSGGPSKHAPAPPVVHSKQADDGCASAPRHADEKYARRNTTHRPQVVKMIAPCGRAPDEHRPEAAPRRHVADVAFSGTTAPLWSD